MNNRNEKGFTDRNNDGLNQLRCPQLSIKCLSRHSILCQTVSGRETNLAQINEPARLQGINWRSVSKHSGTRYGYNRETVNTIWYTDAHEKLYLKNLHMYSIYYHVTNQNQNLQGWIWKGYLKPTSTNPKGSTSTNNSGKASIDNTHQSISSRVQDVLSLFPGTKYSQSASEYLDTDSEDIVQNPDPRSAAQKQDSVNITHSTTLDTRVSAIKQLKTNQITFKQYVANDLKKQNIVPINYSGYTIGISCRDELGDYSILLYR